MQANQESEFIDHFILKSRRDRLMHELSDPKKRFRALDRFAHQTEKLIDPKRIRMQGSTLEAQPAFQAFVTSHDTSVLVCSCDPSIDGMVLALSEGLNAAEYSMEAVLLLGGAFAIIFAEAEKGGREKYLLQL
ncbi:MAG: hypothetical protein IKS32_08455 [Solobacterium sp.]|nr:hypothetical protein [Solobacterium sp.]